MSSKEMASEQRKNEDKKLSEANFHQALGSEELAAETDAFQCGRCKQVCFNIKAPYCLFTNNFLSARPDTINSKPAVPMNP